MTGILLLIIFLFLGLASANRVFAEHPLYIRVWTGLLGGLLGLMWLVVPPSFLLGFGIPSHLAALVTMLILYMTVRLCYKKGGRLKGFPDEKEKTLQRTLFALGVPILLLVGYLLGTHVISPGQDGGLYVGQSTYGDLSLHLGIITSIATQGKFPPEYSIFPGQLLGYPFLVNSLSASLYLFGTSLRWAVLLPSFIMGAMLITGLFALSFEILKNRTGAALTTVLFLFNGGFGFIYFLDGTRKDPGSFTRMFSAFYNTPTNYNEHGIRWSNTLCDMILPQRTAFAGWTFVLLAFWLLHRALMREDRRCFLFAGIVAGLLPMIHTHSFFAFGMISAVWLVVYGWKHKNLKRYAALWARFIIPVGILALPQLLIWTFSQAIEGGFLASTVGIDSSGRFRFGWRVNENDSWLWFWIKNVGPVFLLIIPAWLGADRELRKVTSGALVLFAVAETVQFQPNAYDNNKLFYIWYLFMVILTVAWLTSSFERMGRTRAVRAAGWIFLFVCTFSGLLTVGREVVSRYQLFSPGAVSAADFIVDNTPKDALFLTSDNHNNLVAALTGRSIYSGSPVFLAFHGISYASRESEVRIMYTESTRFKALAEKTGIDYVLVSDWEKGKYNVDQEYFRKHYPVVYDEGEIQIYAVSRRAGNPD